MMADLAKLLPASRVLPVLEKVDTEEVIAEMLDFLVAEGAVPSAERDDYFEAVVEREHEVGTGVGSGVAIPHARVDGLATVQACFGRSLEGAKFDAPDNAPVHFVCLLLVPHDQAGVHLQTLATLAKLMSKCDLREQLMGADSAGEIARLLAQGCGA